MKKILFILIILTMLCAVVACTPSVVNIDGSQADCISPLAKSTTIYDNALKWMKEEYIKANNTNFLICDNCPKDITNIIDNQEDFDNAFYEFPVEIDFDKQMLVVYFFTADKIFENEEKRFYYYELNNATIQGRKLTFDVCKNKTRLLIKGKSYADSSPPTQECLTFLMPRVQMEELVDDIQINIDYKSYYITWIRELKYQAKVYTAELEWLTDEFRQKNIDLLNESKTFITKIQTMPELALAFKKFYDNIDFEDDMAVIYYFEQDNTQEGSYTYKISDVQYDDRGNLDITLTKDKKTDKTSGQSQNLLAIKLPQLPAYRINIKIA